MIVDLQSVHSLVMCDLVSHGYPRLLQVRPISTCTPQPEATYSAQPDCRRDPRSCRVQRKASPIAPQRASRLRPAVGPGSLQFPSEAERTATQRNFIEAPLKRALVD